MAKRCSIRFLALLLGLLAPVLVGPRLAAAQPMPGAFELVGENDTFQLYANRETLAFDVVDLRSGYVWHSNLVEKLDGDRLNKTWTAFAQSGISIDYLDEKAVDQRASISNAERTIDFRPIEQGFAATVTFTEPGISLELIVRLVADGVTVELPFDSIVEADPAFKLGLVYVYPFFGATRSDETPGYMFIPDGVGSLIRFAAATKAKNMFYGRYYGADLGMITTLPWDATINRPYKLSVPVIGMIHGEGEHGYLAIVEKGAAYGEAHAHPSGIITNFNFLYNAFVYNQSYFQATNRSGAGVTTLQPQTNAFDVAIHYRFLTGDESDYVGMARSYQAYLAERGVLRPQTPPGDAIGIRLEFLGAEKEKVLFWHRAVPMTTVAQMRDILARLAVRNPEVVYYGWQPLGASTMPPRTVALERSLGSLAELEAAIEEVAAANGRFYLYLDPQAALLDERGYSERRDLAMSITNFNLVGYNRNKVNYYFNDDTLSDRYSDLSASLQDELPAGLALDGIGSTLYSDFKSNHMLNREQAIARYQTLLGESGLPVALYLPNDYLFGHMRAYYDMPLTNSGYTYTTAAVPFLPIVMSGYVPSYGTALNFSADTRADLLRHADFGVYPSYFVSHEVTARILNTSSSWIYSSSYEQWGAEIRATYEWLNGLLGPVAGAQIIGRDQLAEGVFATRYSNGHQIIVNYNAAAFRQGDLLVAGEDAILLEATP